MGRGVAVALLTVLAACGGDDAAVDGGELDGPPPDAAPRPDPGASLGSFQLTYYYVVAQADYAGAANATIYDDSCAALAAVPSAFVDALDIEGTGRLSDGRLVNVSGGCGCAHSPCYAVADANHPWGYGVQNRALEPFRSVAVDPSVVAYGTGLYLPALDGVTVPGDPPWGGFVHDGCVVAADTGGAIVGAHLDFFVGLRSAYLTLDGELGLSATDVRDGGARCADQ